MICYGYRPGLIIGSSLLLQQRQPVSARLLTTVVVTGGNGQDCFLSLPSCFVWLFLLYSH
jgi:hypothetical protein